MKRFKVKALILTFSSVAILTISTTVYALNSNNVSKESKATVTEESVSIINIAKEFNKSPESIKDLKTDLKDLKVVYKNLVKEKHIQKNMAESKKEELLEKGYSLKDIQKAEEWAALSDKSSEEIVLLKGTTPNSKIEIIKDEEGHDKSIVTDVSGKLWDAVLAKLNIDLKKVAENLGVAPADIEKMSQQGLSPREMYEITAMSIGFNKNYAEIWADYNTEPSLETLQVRYSREEIKKNPIAMKPELSQKETEELVIKKAYKITDEEVVLFKQNSITDYMDMGRAKHLASKNKKTLQDVLKVKKNTNTWNEVSTKLEAEKQ